MFEPERGGPPGSESARHVQIETLMYVRRLLPDADAVFALSPEELAGYVLENLNAEAKSDYRGEDAFTANQGNFLNGVETEYKNHDVTNAFALAWRFMIQQGYIADVPATIGHGWYRLTRKGREITEHGRLQAPRVPRAFNPGPPPSFKPLTMDPPLLKHLHVLWEEAVSATNGDAYLSALIMLGSLLEGALLAKCLSNDVAAKGATNAPRDKHGIVKDYRSWSLNDFIGVGSELGWIHKTRNDFADTLRDYRNMVHPFNAYNRDYRADRGMVDIAWAVVRATLKDLGVTV